MISETSQTDSQTDSQIDSQTDQHIVTFADAEAVLANALPGYEQRLPQQAFAALVEDTFAKRGNALAEAGCGVGKSLGALIPSILAGIHSDQRTVVATATNALTAQYSFKDMPFLAEHLGNAGVDFTWALLKGRSNYACRAKMVAPDARLDPALLARVTAEIEADPEHDGDRDNITTPVSPAEFSLLTSTGDECPGRKRCPFGDVCFAEAAKSRAKSASVVITNVAMLITDLKVQEMTDGKGSMLGAYDNLIVDEAHLLEEIATSQLEETFRPRSIDLLVSEVVSYAHQQDGTLHHDGDVLAANAAVMAALPEIPKGSENVRLTLGWFTDNAEPFISLIEAFSGLREDILGITTFGDDKVTSIRERLLKRIATQISRWSTLITAPEGDVVRWIQSDEFKGRQTTILHFAPINVGPYLAERIWDNPEISSVLVSATMSVGGDFTYIKDRLGFGNDVATLDVGTPFNFNTQALLFVPARDLPAPNKDRSAWMSYTVGTSLDMINASGGGALLLFTSRSAMQNAHSIMASHIEARGVTVLMQGEAGLSNKALAKIFAEDTHSVLFALKSFFTGVDIPGDACRLVIIDKLAFAVPTDPVLQARSDAIKRRGGSDFKELAIPMMTLTLLQAYGRLIRRKEDRGVVAILDSRLSSTPWGRRVVDSLPDSPATTHLADVEAFYA